MQIASILMELHMFSQTIKCAYSKKEQVMDTLSYF